ncbi:unnamed protein product [Rotaria sordida]|uniref:Uncharacterized protein n=1 Tax=Rotaria sordida TaxID=392033 RepID=A0A815DLD2_9BILA|nr:unnamed protein product [Rotaria sordida]
MCFPRMLLNFVNYLATLSALVSNNESITVTDSGCTITGAIEALEEWGTCLESLWPYDLNNANLRPSDEAYDEAINHRITEAFQISDLYEMKACLAQGFPFAFGLRLFKSFERAGDFGHVHIPKCRDHWDVEDAIDYQNSSEDTESINDDDDEIGVIEEANQDDDEQEINIQS